jgi:hypothetical protein
MPAPPASAGDNNEETTKAALFFIAAGILVLSYAVYEYVHSYGPPAHPFTPVTTAASMQAPNATTLPFEASTTQLGYVRATLHTVIVTMPTAPSTTTTTLFPESCMNRKLDTDETYVDCGMQCGNCILMNLSTTPKRYLNENLWLAYEGYNITVIAGGPCKDVNWSDLRDRPVELLHYCKDKTLLLRVLSTEETPDYRQMKLDEVEYIDGFELKIFEDLNQTVRVYVKRDINAVQLIPEYALLTIGGGNCVTNNTGFCRRHWDNYSFRVRTRETDTVRLDLTLPSGKKLENVQLNKSGTLVLEGAKIGLLYPYQKGGYCTIYVRKSNN